MDDRWEVQHQCIKFLHDALPTFGNVSYTFSIINFKGKQAGKYKQEVY